MIVASDDPVPGAPIEVGLNATDTPAGCPLADSVTALLKPLMAVVVMVDDPIAPWAMLTADGEAEIVRSGTSGTVTVRFTVVLWFKLPSKAEIVTG